MEERQKDRIEEWLDKHFEIKFFSLRYIAIVSVIFLFIGSILMFWLGTYETIKAILCLFRCHKSKECVILLIKSIDAFLFGLVLMISSYGIYDLFISRLEPAEKPGIRPNWIRFKDISSLKNILVELIIIILTIAFFEAIEKNINIFKNPWQFLIIPIGIFLIAISISQIRRSKHQ